MPITNVSGITMSSVDVNGAINLATLLNPLETDSAGSAYSLTATPAALHFGTTDPSITLTQAGTYLILARANMFYNGATFAAPRVVTLKLSRTNNTPADLTAASLSLTTNVITALTYTFDTPSWWTMYTTANTNDIINIQGSVAVIPTLGTIDVTSASILAIKV